MNFLVLSNQHSLLPFAHRLQRDNHSVESIIYNPGNRSKYEGAYAGVIELTLHQGEKTRYKKIEALKELATEGNSPRAAKDFREAKTLFSTLKNQLDPIGVLRFGAWFDGEQFLRITFRVRRREQKTIYLCEGTDRPLVLHPLVRSRFRHRRSRTLIRVWQPSRF